VIVVIGSPFGRIDDGAISAAGSSSRVALAAAAAGRAVQLVGKTGDDPIADGVILDLARGGVGHVALLRDPARATPLERPPTDEPPGGDADVAAGAADHDGPDTAALPAWARAVGMNDGPALEAADVDLGLRYLTEFAVVVLAEPVSPEIVTIVGDAARWGEARMILVVRAGEHLPDGLPDDVVVLAAPDADPEAVFATLVGRFAAALDEGVDPREAFRASVASDGWTGAGAG
jgi:hypothetical protein